jgi:hypothetical protein
MSQKARIKEAGSLIQLWNLDKAAIERLEDKIELGKTTLVCADSNCGGQMHLRAVDSWIKTHFAHNPGQVSSTCPNRPGESPEHRLSKKRIAQFLQDKYPDSTVEVEYSVPDTVFAKRRQIDVAVFHPDGKKEAHETQRSYQTSKRFRQRSSDYAGAGFDRVVWWLSGRADKRDYREWCANHCANFGRIAFKYDTVMGVEVLTEAILQYIDSEWQREKWRKFAEARAENIAKRRRNYRPSPPLFSVDRKPQKELERESKDYWAGVWKNTYGFTPSKPERTKQAEQNWAASPSVKKMLAPEVEEDDPDILDWYLDLMKND